MNWSSSVRPSRKSPAWSSKSSNSFSMTGMMWPGMFSRISGFSREPRRPRFGVSSVVGAVGSMEPTNITKPVRVSYFLLPGWHVGVLGDRSPSGFQLESGLGPGEQPAVDRVRIPARSCECVGRGARAVARAAVEDYRLFPVQRSRLALDVRERDVARAGDVPHLVFHVRADVDQLAARLDDLLGLCGPYLWHGAAGYSVTRGLARS